MNTCNIAGKVLKSAVDTNTNGKRVGKVRIEVRKKYGEKSFSTRFDCHVYGNDADAVGSIPVGAIAWASGEVQAFLNEYQGKTYANLQLVGRVGVVDAGNFEEHKRQFERHSAPPCADAPAPPKAAPADSGGPPPEEDDVPF